MKATNLIVGQKYIWMRNSSTQHEVTFIGVDESGKYTQYVFEYEKQGNKYYTYLSVHHVDSDIKLLSTNVNNLAQYIEEFKNNPCIATYSNLYNCGIYMYMLVSNAWQRVTTYKSDFSDIEVGGGLYNSPDINDVSGVWVLRKF